jgi:hypothetical protein
MEVPPENKLSRPTIEGDIVENVVPLMPLAACEAMDGTCLGHLG